MKTNEFHLGDEATLSNPEIILIQYMDTFGNLQQGYFAEIPNCGGAYAISTGATVISLQFYKNLNGLPFELAKNENKDGYLYVCIHRENSKGNRNFIHQLAAETYLKKPRFDDFLGNSRNEVNHLDGNKHNNKPSNLGFMSRTENLKWNKVKNTIKQEKLLLKAHTSKEA